jgi:tetratricopeptide (TPR) repeat protein
LNEARQLSEESKFSHSPPPYFWLRFRTELLQILYNQRKFTDCLDLISKIEEEAQPLKDRFFSRIASQYHSRILIKQGLIKQGLEKAELLEMTKKEETFGRKDEGKKDEIKKDEKKEGGDGGDIEWGLFWGDIGETLFERKEFEKARKYFEESVKMMEGVLKELAFEVMPRNRNEKAVGEGIQVCEEMGISNENEQEIMRRNENKGGKGGKKEEKKGIKDLKDDKNKKDLNK